MLPFMKAKRIASVIVERHKKDGSTKDSSEITEESSPMAEVAEQLINAVHSKNVEEVASILQKLKD